jgi:hypothetical protein
MNKLLKDAIADAKAVRETALANAKLALEEAFAPKLQSMLSHKIKEEMEEEEPKEDEMESGEGMGAEGMSRMKELAGLSEEEDEMSSDEEEMDSEEEEMDMDSEEGSEEEYSDEDEDLDEILRELDAEEEMETEGEEDNFNYEGGEMHGDESDEMNEGEGEEGEDEEINLDELIQALREEEGEDEDAVEQPMDTKGSEHGKGNYAGKPDDLEEAKKMKMKMKKMEEDLNEAYGAVKFLRTKLSEVNLLNAKLLYVNKLFRKNGLTEAQKLKIVETFDRARSVRETKLVYATLSESISNPAPAKSATRTKVTEGFASAASKKTNIITEGNQQINRFKELAGIK